MQRVGIAVLIASAVGLSTALLGVLREESVREVADIIFIAMLIAGIVGYAITAKPSADE